MNRDELLQRLKENGTFISPHQLRRYITYGLIQSEKNSRGRGTGVRATFSDRTVTAIRDIAELQNHSHIKNSRELIFVLFARGYLVNMEVLKEYFVEHFYQIVDLFKYLIDSNENDVSGYLQSSEELVSTKELPRRKPGRPSNENNSERDRMIRIELRKYRAFVQVAKELLTRKPIPVGTLIEYLQSLEIGDTNVLGLNGISDLVDLSLWEKMIRGATNEDFLEIQQIFRYALYYIESFMEIDPEALPVIGERIARTRELLHGIRFVELPVLVKIVTVTFLNSDWREHVLRFLESKQHLIQWGDMLMDLRTTMASAERR